MLKPLLLMIFLFLSLLGQGKEIKKFHYSGEKILSLDGKWEFYWKKLLYAGDSCFENGGFEVEMPDFWNDHEIEGYNSQSFGYATYRTIIVSDVDRKIALEYAGPHSAQRIYINGKLISETGKVSTSSKKHVGLWLPGLVDAELKKGENELIIHISNFGHARGGLYETPIIGNRPYLHSRRKHGLFSDTFIAGGLSVIGLFFIGLSIFWRNNRLFVYFGLFTILFSFWYMNYGMHAFKVSFPSISWALSFRLTYLAFYGFMFFISLFTYESAKHFFGKRYVQVVIIGYSFLLVPVIFGTPLLFSSLKICAYFLVFGQLLFMAFKFTGIVRMKVQKYTARHLLIPSMVLASIVILVWLFSNMQWVSEILGVLFLVIFLVLAISMSGKVGGDYRKILALQREAIKQNEKINEQARKLQILDETKTRFFANVSHDLRSPLTLIKGSIRKIRKQSLELEQNSHEEFETIDMNVEQLIRFTDEIRDLNLLEQNVLMLTYSEVELQSFLKATFNMFESFAEIRGISLIFIPPKKKIVIRTDKEKLRRVMNNLISNAFKFNKDNGSIELSIDETKNGVSIELKDSGLGIAQEELPFIFDRFYQSKENIYRSREGMGIGLSLVKELVELHEGKIDVKSQLEVGTVFTIFLPYNFDKPLSETEKESEVKRMLNVRKSRSNNDKEITKVHQDQSGKTILLVDDHQEVRKYIASVIHEEYTVFQVENGAEAYAFLKKQRVDLVITDLMMPLMDGFELIDKMNDDIELSTIRIMVVSARTTREDQLKVLNKGVNEFLSKPFDEDEFNTRISNLIRSDKPSLISELAEKKGKYSSIEEKAIAKINDLILDQIDNSKLSTTILADALATSERNASRIIKKLTGYPPKTYIQHVRMNYVELLIKDGKVSNLTEAGLSVGMKNATQFAKQFEKVKGYPPLQK
ncbi:MAG: ATP-binding protein [Crocinitomicaceae bacterium]